MLRYYVYLALTALILCISLPAKHYFYITEPHSLIVHQLAMLRADRSGFVDGTIEVTVPVSLSNIGAGLLNDPGPCNIIVNDTVNVICFPTQDPATLYVWGYVGPHTSPLTITGQATSQTFVIGDTAQLTVRGVLSHYIPSLAR